MFGCCPSRVSFPFHELLVFSPDAFMWVARFLIYHVGHVTGDDGRRPLCQLWPVGPITGKACLSLGVRAWWWFHTWLCSWSSFFSCAPHRSYFQLHLSTGTQLIDVSQGKSTRLFRFREWFVAANSWWNCGGHMVVVAMYNCTMYARSAGGVVRVRRFPCLHGDVFCV